MTNEWLEENCISYELNDQQYDEAFDLFVYNPLLRETIAMMTKWKIEMIFKQVTQDETVDFNNLPCQLVIQKCIMS